MKSPGARPKINARDYKPLDMPERAACYVCRSTWSDYVEKPTEERRHRKDKTARRICKGRFQSAKGKARNAAVFLPGISNVTRAGRVTAGIGR